MSRALTLVLAAAASLMATPQEPAPPRAAAFSVRANPQWAAAVNRALADVAQPVEAYVPSDTTPAAFLSRLCGGHRATVLETHDDVVHFAPCVRIDRNVSVTVTRGDTLEGLAARNGLPRTATKSMKVVPKGRTASVASRTVTVLSEGDKVVIPQVPRWTQIVVRPDLIADRDAFVRALARRLSCGRLEPEDCLARRDVSVLTRASVPVARGRGGIPPGTITLTAGAARRTLESAPAVAGPPAPVAAAPPPDPAVWVAPEQWPFDSKLIAAIVQDAASKMPDFRPAHVGVVDGGFATKKGPPSLAGIFGDGDDLPDDNNLDDEGNTFVDDNFGVGVARPGTGGHPGESTGTGNLSFCASPTLDISGWPMDVVRIASHGAVVVSLAAGRRIRLDVPPVAGRMPKVVFFRMLGNVCEPTGDFRATAGGEIPLAYEYFSSYRLSTKVQVVNVSYSVPNGPLSRQLFRDMQDIVPHNNRLLVVASGDSNENLDKSGGCPACLGKEDRTNRASRHTLVVGAATRDLRRASYSGFGRETVLMYAPGEPVGAVDLNGGDVPSSDVATSYAAPYVTFAAGLMISLGMSPEDVNDRLRAATWPIDAPDTEVDRDRAGVLDLARAAAVRHDAIVVKETAADGSTILRTYVGTLDPIADLCPGTGISRTAVHAIRLGEPAPDGERVFRLSMRSQPDPDLDHVGRKAIKLAPCRPKETATATIRSLISGTTPASDTVKTFPLADVRAIQWRWIQ